MPIARFPVTRVLAVAALWLSAVATAAPSAAATVHRLGHTDDSRPTTTGPAYYFKGDGAPEPISFSQYLAQVADGPLDVVVLGASYPGWDGECRSLMALAQVSSCTTAVVRSDAEANDPTVLDAVGHAEVVYFRGGDQCNFVRWKYTALYDAVRDVVERRGGVGGGSAGLAIQGSLAVYDGCTGSVSSVAAMRDPVRSNISFTHEYFSWPHLDRLVTDSHFVERNRMGRLVTFLCRQQALGRTDEAWGLGLDAHGVMVIDKQGQATVVGQPAYVVLADGDASGCASAAGALTYRGVKVWRLEPGARFDFARRPSSGYYKVDVVDGLFTRPPYAPPAGARAPDSGGARSAASRSG